jgi:hypothetical protein
MILAEQGNIISEQAKPGTKLFQASTGITIYILSKHLAINNFKLIFVEEIYLF